LDQGSHNVAWRFAEVYDHSEPPDLVRDVAAVEAFAVRKWIELSVIWSCDRLQDRGGLVDDVRSATEDVAAAALVVDDLATVRVCRLRDGLIRDAAVGIGAPLRACVNRSASSPAGRACR